MGDVGAALAAALYAASIVILLGVRSWRQRRATGSTGFTGLRGARTPMARVGGGSFVIAVLAGLLSPVLVALDVLPVVWLAPGQGLSTWAGAGLVLTVTGFALAVVAQNAMGTSWRIGVDPDERTDLVTDGVFAAARNPIFTALVMIQAGTALLAPTAVALVGIGALLLACQIQVRLVEEPHLLATHGRSYTGYAARTGRFVPLLGRLPDVADAPAAPTGGPPHR